MARATSTAHHQTAAASTKAADVKPMRCGASRDGSRSLSMREALVVDPHQRSPLVDSTIMTNALIFRHLMHPTSPAATDDVEAAGPQARLDLLCSYDRHYSQTIPNCQ